MVGAKSLAGHFSKKSDKSEHARSYNKNAQMKESVTKPEINTNNKKDSSSNFTK